MTHVANYPLFGVICALGVIAFLSCLQAYIATCRSDAAMIVAQSAQVRLDRMQKHVTVSHRETVEVPYDEGWQPRDSWVDDFKRTQQVPVFQLTRKLSWFRRFVRWFFS